MLARVRQHVKERGVGIAASLAIHGLLLALALLVAAPASRPHVKRGEALFVELPQLPEPPPAGNPGARTPGPPLASREARATPPPARPAPPAAKPATPATKPSPPVARPAPPAARPSLPDATPALPDVKPAPPDVAKPPAPPVVARAPEPEAPKPPAATAAPPIPEGPSPEARAPEPPRPTPAPDGASAAKTAPSESQPSSGGQQIASVPPAGESAPLDIRSLGRGGGAGSARGGGRGGVEGEPIPLDSKDPKYSDYLDHVRRKIKANWGYPCVKDGDTRGCEYKTASLIVEFGIAKNGHVPFVNVVRSSGWPVYDDYAVNAIKFASPFLPVPDALSKKGIPVLATFNYVVDTSLTNLLR